MSNLDPETAISTCETALRQLMSYCFEREWGTQWVERVLNDDKIAASKQRCADEEKSRMPRGVAAVRTELINYVYFYDLVRIATKHWDLLAPALGPKREFLPLLERFERLRNPVAHTRLMVPFEQDLLSGIAGELRNRVTLYMSDQEAGEFYSRIESITDSFGNRLDGLETLKSSNPIVMTSQTLRPGDQLTFTCVGTHPEGGDLHWSVTSLPPSDIELKETAETVTFKVAITQKHASDNSSFHIKLQSDAPYSRWPEGYDGLGLFYYKINPK